jgi:hypothetical protein
MPWLANDVISIKLFQKHLDQEVMNNLTYLIVDSGLYADIDKLLDAYATLITQYFVPLQSDALNHYLIRADNLTDTISFCNKNVDIDGDISGNDLPSYVAASFTKRVYSKLTRPGVCGWVVSPKDRWRKMCGYQIMMMLTHWQQRLVLLFQTGRLGTCVYHVLPW